MLDVGFLSATSRAQVERAAVVAAVRGALPAGLRALSAGQPATGVVEGPAVRFADGVRTLHEHGVRRFFELGPDAVLTAVARQTLDDAVLAAARRAGKSEPQTFAGLPGQAHAAGVAIDWPAVCPGAEEGQHASQRIEAGTTADEVFPADRRRARHRLRTVTAIQGIQGHER